MPGSAGLTCDSKRAQYTNVHFRRTEDQDLRRKVSESEQIGKQCYVVYARKNGAACDKNAWPRTEVGHTNALFVMWYAAWNRTIAEVSVQTANVRAWRSVTCEDDVNISPKMRQKERCMSTHRWVLCHIISVKVSC